MNAASGAQNRVGIAANLKAGLRPGHDAQRPTLHVLLQDPTDFSGNSTMLKSGGRHRNQFSVDQLAPPQPRRLEQFCSGHKMFGGIITSLL